MSQFVLHKNGGFICDINLPARVEVDDYHELPFLQDILRQIIPKVKVVEVGCAPARYLNRPHGVYHAVVYLGDKREPEVQRLIREIKQEEGSD